MSILVLNTIQLGNSAAVNNFTLDASAGNGTLTLNRGGIGSALSNILTIDSSNNVTIQNDLTIESGSIAVATPTGSVLNAAVNTQYVQQVVTNLYAYRSNYAVGTAVTSLARGTSIAIDSVGNVYWAVTNNGTASSFTQAAFAYVYRIDAVTRQQTTVVNVSMNAVVTPNGWYGTHLAFDQSGNLYWSITTNQTSGTNYLYKIVTASNSLTLMYSYVNTYGAYQHSHFTFDTQGNIYWANAFYYDGTATYAGTSKIFKITPSGTTTTFATLPTVGTWTNRVAFDGNGNLYWAIASAYNGSSHNLTSSVYVIPAGSNVPSQFASFSTFGASFELAIDANNNVYCAVVNGIDDTNNSHQNSYLYRITPAGVKTLVATIATNSPSVGGSPSMLFDSKGNIILSISSIRYSVAATGNAYLGNSYVYKITPAGKATVLHTRGSSYSLAAAIGIDPITKNIYYGFINSQSAGYDGSIINNTNAYLDVIEKVKVV